MVIVQTFQDVTRVTECSVHLHPSYFIPKQTDVFDVRSVNIERLTLSSALGSERGKWVNS